MAVTISTLSNGLRVATDSMMDAESVVTGLWVNAGTRDEPWAANGVAHLVEHMMFKGTKTRSAYALSDAIEKNGGMVNAFTTREQTAYYARVLPEHVASTLDVLSDMLMRSVFNSRELARERQVIVQEIGRDLDSPEVHIMDLVYEKAFPQQRFGRPILGSSAVIASMPREKVVTYVKKHYHAGAMVLLAAGKIEHQEFVGWAQKYFGRLPKGRPVVRERATMKAGGQYTKRDIEQLHLVIGFPACNLYHPAFEATQIFSVLLGGGSASRLFQNIREKRGLVYTINSDLTAYSDTGFFQIYAGTDPKRVGELIPAVSHEMLDTTRRLTQGELQRAKQQWRADLLMGQESVMRRADNLGQHILVYNRAPDLASSLRKGAAVSKSALTHIARTLLKKSPVVAALGPLAHLESYRSVVGRFKV